MISPPCNSGLRFLVVGASLDDYGERTDRCSSVEVGIRIDLLSESRTNEEYSDGIFSPA